MASFLNSLSDDNFLWDICIDYIPSFKKSNTDFVNFNCPMCSSRGHNPDRKKRCGIIRSNEGMGISCFNCNFSTKWQVGKPLTRKWQEFLEQIGVPEKEISRIVFQARRVARIFNDSAENPNVAEAFEIFKEPSFPRMELPENTLSLFEWADLGCTDNDFVKVAEYAFSRGDVILNNANMMWSPTDEYKDRVIIPFYHKNEIVGYTARAILDTAENKYINHMPPNLLFNSAALYNDREYVILVEGPLDGVAIDGVSPFGSKLSKIQANWLKYSGKKVIVVPDRDAAGQNMIDIALTNNFMVSFPKLKSGTSIGRNWWDDDIKDCDQAVRRHGRLYTIRSIMENITTNKTEIAIKRKIMV